MMFFKPRKTSCKNEVHDKVIKQTKWKMEDGADFKRKRGNKRLSYKPIPYPVTVQMSTDVFTFVCLSLGNCE